MIIGDVAMIRFTELVDRYKYPANHKTQINSFYNKIFAYVCDHYDGTKSFKFKVTKAFNTVAYLVVNGEDFWDSWDESNCLNCLPDIPDAKLRSSSISYLSPEDIKWDIEIVDDADLSTIIEEPKLINDSYDSKPSKSWVPDTDPQDLYIEGPVVPRVDCSKVWKSGILDGRRYAVYKSIPDIPTRQCEISLTTNADMMTSDELINLYPNNRMFTRCPELYSRIDRIEFDSFLGCILHVSGFSRQQMIDNIIKYPHIQNLYREGKHRGVNKLVDFWKYIEIDGQLHKTIDVWDKLEDTCRLPKIRAIMEDYVVRRYLLERDVNHVDHKYKLYGELDPFLTLFMPSEDYIKLGYRDSVDIAKQCVNSRITYKRSRNPILRRLDTIV